MKRLSKPGEGKWLQQGQHPSPDLMKTWSIAKLKSFLKEKGIDYSSFLEKSEFVSAAVKAANIDDSLSSSSSSSLPRFTVAGKSVRIDVPEQILQSLFAMNAKSGLNEKQLSLLVNAFKATPSSDQQSLCIQKMFALLASDMWKYRWRKQNWEDTLDIASLLSLLQWYTCGEDPSSKNEDGLTPLEVAKETAQKISKACGLVWEAGDVAYKCKTCSMDPTCAICVECFQNGNHKGHDYRMISTGGGCCDCGDDEAWRVDGFCSRHGLQTKKEANGFENLVHTFDEDQILRLHVQVQVLVEMLVHLTCLVRPRVAFSNTAHTDNPISRRKKFKTPYKRPATSDSSSASSSASVASDQNTTSSQPQRSEHASSFQTASNLLPNASGNARVSEPESHDDVEGDFLDDEDILEEYELDDENEMEISEVYDGLVDEDWMHDGGMDSEEEEDPFEGDEIDSDLLDAEMEDEMGNFIPPFYVGMVDLDDSEDSSQSFSDASPNAALEEQVLLSIIDFIKVNMESYGDAYRNCLTAALLGINTMKVAEGESTNGSFANLAKTIADMEKNKDRMRIFNLDKPVELEIKEDIAGAEENDFEFKIVTDGSEEVVATRFSDFKDSKKMLAQRFILYVSEENSIPLLCPIGDTLATLDSNRAEHYGMINEKMKVGMKCPLQHLVLRDCSLSSVVRKSLHEIYFQLLQHPQFKLRFALYLTGLYCSLNQLGMQISKSNSILEFSVQIFTVPSIATLLVRKYKLYHVFIKTLDDLFGDNLEVDQETLDLSEKPNYQYSRVLYDMRYTMRNEGVQEYFLHQSTFPNFIRLVGYLQMCNKQVRFIRNHIPIEPRTWMESFNLELMMEYIIAIAAQTFGDSQKDKVVEASSATPVLPSTPMTMEIKLEPVTADRSSKNKMYYQAWKNICEAVSDYEDFVDVVNDYYEDLRTNTEPDYERIANLFEHQEKSSFHIPLHHLFILTLIEGYPLLSQKLCIPHVDRDFMKSVIIAPLHVFRFRSHVEAGRWRRNGFSLIQQSKLYADVNFCGLSKAACSRVDLDVALLQLGASYLQAEEFIRICLANFQIDLPTFSTDSLSIDTKGGVFEQLPLVQRRIMDSLEGEGYYDYITVKGTCKSLIRDPDEERVSTYIRDFLHLLVWIVNDRQTAGPWVTTTNEEERKRGFIRKEIVHKLFLGPCTHTELVKALPKSVSGDNAFKEELKNVAVFSQSTAMEQGRFSMKKDSLWEEYDPYFIHYSGRDAQTARENYGSYLTSLKPPKPRTNAFVHLNEQPPSAPFASTLDILQSPLLHGVMFSILLAALSPHIRKHEAAREKGFPKRKDRVTELAAESSIPILVHAPSSPVPAGVTETHHLTSTVDVVLQLVLFAVEHAARVRKEGECNCSKTEEEKNPTKTCPLIFDWKCCKFRTIIEHMIIPLCVGINNKGKAEDASSSAFSTSFLEVLILLSVETDHFEQHGAILGEIISRLKKESNLVVRCEKVIRKRLEGSQEKIEEENNQEIDRVKSMQDKVKEKFSALRSNFSENFDWMEDISDSDEEEEDDASMSRQASNAVASGNESSPGIARFPSLASPSLSLSRFASDGRFSPMTTMSPSMLGFVKDPSALFPVNPVDSMLDITPDKVLQKAIKKKISDKADTCALCREAIWGDKGPSGYVGLTQPSVVLRSCYRDALLKERPLPETKYNGEKKEAEPPRKTRKGKEMSRTVSDDEAYSVYRPHLAPPAQLSNRAPTRPPMARMHLSKSIGGASVSRGSSSEPLPCVLSLSDGDILYDTANASTSGNIQDIDFVPEDRASKGDTKLYDMDQSAGVFLKLCGHIIHMDCHKSYVEASLKSDSADYDTERGIFTCPVCRTMSNILVPAIPPGCVYRALPESSPDDEGDVTEDDAGPVLVLDNDSMIQKSSVPQKLLDNFDNFPKLQMKVLEDAQIRGLTTSNAALTLRLWNTLAQTFGCLETSDQQLLFERFERKIEEENEFSGSFLSAMKSLRTTSEIVKAWCGLSELQIDSYHTLVTSVLSYPVEDEMRKKMVSRLNNMYNYNISDKLEWFIEGTISSMGEGGEISLLSVELFSLFVSSVCAQANRIPVQVFSSEEQSKGNALPPSVQTIASTERADSGETQLFSPSSLKEYSRLLNRIVGAGVLQSLMSYYCKLSSEERDVWYKVHGEEGTPIHNSETDQEPIRDRCSVVHLFSIACKLMSSSSVYRANQIGLASLNQKDYKSAWNCLQPKKSSGPGTSDEQADPAVPQLTADLLTMSIGESLGGQEWKSVVQSQGKKRKRMIGVNDQDAATMIKSIKRRTLPLLRRIVLFFKAMFGSFADTIPPYSTMDEESQFDLLWKFLDLPAFDDYFHNPQRMWIAVNTLLSLKCTNRNGLRANLTGPEEMSPRERFALRVQEMIHTLPEPSRFDLIDLPKTLQDKPFFNKYMLFAKCENCNEKPGDPGICLICGTLVCSMESCCRKNNLGEANQHVRTCGAGIGMYLLVKNSNILFLRRHGGTLYNSPYLDEFGEEDPGLARGRDLHLNAERYEKLREIFLRGDIFRRTTGQRVRSIHWDLL